MGKEQSLSGHMINNIDKFDTKKLDKLSGVTKNNEIENLVNFHKIYKNKVTPYITKISNSIIDNSANDIVNSIHNTLGEFRLSDTEKNNIANILSDNIVEKQNNLTKNGKAIIGKNLNKKFEDTLKNVTKMKLLEFVNKNKATEAFSKTDIQKLSSSITQSTFDTLGKFDGSNHLDMEAIKKDITNALEKTLTNGSKDNPKSIFFTKVNQSFDKTLGNAVDKQSPYMYKLNDSFKNNNVPLDLTREELNTIQTGFNNAKVKPLGVHIGSGDIKSKVDYTINPLLVSKQTKEYADMLSKQSFVIHDKEKSLKIINEYKNKTDKELIRTTDNYNAKLFDNLFDKNGNFIDKGNSEDFYYKEIKGKLDSYRRDLNNLQDLVNSYNQGDNIHFDVKLNDNNRVMYDAIISPHSSSFARHIIVPKDMAKFDISNAEHIELFKRHIADEFGSLDSKNIEASFNETVDNLKQKAENNNLTYKEHFALNDIQNYEDALKNNKTSFSAFSEIDGANNGYANIMASLGIKDSGTGIGEKLSKQNELYVKLAKELTKQTGIEFTRKDVKYVAVGKLYGSGSYASTETLIDGLITSNPNTIVKLMDKYLPFTEIKDSINDKLSNQLNQIQNAEKLIGEFNKLTKDGKISEANKINKELNKEIDKIASSKLIGKDAGDIRNLLLADYKFRNTNELSSLTNSEYNAIKSYLIKKAKNNVTNSLEKTLNKEFQEFFDAFEAVNTSTAIRFMNEMDGSIINHNELETQLKGKDFINQERLKNHPIHSGLKTKKAVLEHLLKENIIKPKDIFSLNFVKENIPFIYNPMGEKVYLIKLDSIGFDKKHGLRFNTISHRDLSFVIHNISIDASTVKNVKPNQLPLFDAVAGGSDVIETAKAMNNDLGAVYKEYNPYKNLLDTLENFGANNPKEFEKSLNNLAVLNVLKKDGVTLSPETIKAEKDRLNTILNKFRTNQSNELKNKNIVEINNGLNDTIGAKAKEISNRKNKISNNGTIDQFSLGGKLTEVKLSDIKTKLPNKQINRQVEFHPSRFNFDSLKTVLAKENLNEENFKLKSLFSTKDSSYTVKSDVGIEVNPNITNAYFQGNKIVLPSLDKNPETFINIIHELIHHSVTDVNGEIKHQALNKWFNDLFPEINNEINTKGIQNNGDEALAHVLSELLYNEVVFTNKELFSNLFKDSAKDGIIDLSKQLRTSETSGIMQQIKEIFPDVNIQSAIDLKDVMNKSQELGKSEITNAIQDQLGTVVRDVLGTFNSSTKLGQWIRSKNINEFKPVATGSVNNVIDNTINKILVDRTKIAKQTAKIRDIGLFEMFQIDANREAMEKALALSNGANNNISESVAHFNENANNIIDAFAQKIGKTKQTTDQIMGNSILSGLNIFAKYDKFKELNFSDTTSLQNSIFEILKNEKNKLRDSINNVDISTSIINDIEKLAKALSDGKVGSSIPLSKRIRSTVNSILDKTPRGSDILNTKKNIDLVNDVIKLTKMEASYNRVSNFGKSMDKITNILSDTNNVNDYKTLLDMYNNSADKNSLFGENIFLDVYNKDNKLSAVKVTKENRKDLPSTKRVATVYQDGKEYAVIPKETLNQTIGSQESQVFDFSLRDYEKGVYKVFKGKKKDTNIFVNGQNVNTANPFVDASYSRMSTRNFYAHQKQDAINDILFQQYKIMKDNGLLMTQSDINKLDLEARKDFSKLPASNPISQMYGNHYFNKKYMHYLLGSKGMNPYKLYLNAVGNKQLAKILANTTKVLVDAVKIAKGLILTSRPSSYINSFVSSWAIAMTHGVNPKVFNKAKSLYKEYQELNRQYVSKFINEGEAKAKEFYQNQVEKHPLHRAFQHGIANTIREDSYRLGTFESNEVYKIFNKVLDDRGSNIMKTVTLDPSTKVGKTLGTIFDETEIIPKVALYLKQKELTNEELASQYVLMAFPTYNNLNPVLNAIDKFVPFTKYWYSMPKMLAFALEKNPKVFLASQFAMYALPYATYLSGTNTKQDNYFEHNGFAKISHNIHYYTNSLNPYNVFDFFAKKSDISNGGPSNIYHMFTSSYNLIPLTFSKNSSSSTKKSTRTKSANVSKKSITYKSSTKKKQNTNNN